MVVHDKRFRSDREVKVQVQTMKGAQNSLNPKAPIFIPEQEQQPLIIQMPYSSYPTYPFPSPPSFIIPCFYYFNSPPTPLMSIFHYYNYYYSHQNYFSYSTQLPTLLSEVPYSVLSLNHQISSTSTQPDHQEEKEAAEEEEEEEENTCHAQADQADRVVTADPRVVPKTIGGLTRSLTPKRRRNYMESHWVPKTTKTNENCNSEVSRVVPLHANYTTVMIKNIPISYTREKLLDFLDTYCDLENKSTSLGKFEVESDDQNVSAFDFLYLPMDFRSKMNKGYAFVNFTSSNSARKFHNSSDHDQPWKFSESNKRRQIVKAKMQGKQELVRCFEDRVFPCEFDDFLPVCFSPPRDGSKRMVIYKTIGRRISLKKGND